MVYLAMTAAELQYCKRKPEHIAWMACHFSPYGTGLSNLPTSLPENSLLILNDRTPIHGHDPARVAETLHETVEKFQCSGILLDFQRKNSPETASIVNKILKLSCPVCVSEPYGRESHCPIFVPPIPLLKTTEEYLSLWQGREIWLELALDASRIKVTENGTAKSGLEIPVNNECPNCDRQLNLHYGFHFNEKEAVFTLKRHKSDLQNLMNDAEKWGASKFVGLWQELG